jgi:hypothetical protein
VYVHIQMSEQANTVCARCAAEDEELTPVWAVGDEVGDEPGDEPELWCSECRETNPHEPVAEEDEDEPEE